MFHNVKCVIVGLVSDVGIVASSCAKYAYVAEDEGQHLYSGGLLFRK